MVRFRLEVRYRNGVNTLEFGLLRSDTEGFWLGISIGGGALTLEESGFVSDSGGSVTLLGGPFFARGGSRPGGFQTSYA